LLKKVSLIAFFGTALFVLFTMIEAGAVSYESTGDDSLYGTTEDFAPSGTTEDFAPSGATGGFSPSEVSQYDEAPQYDVAEGEIMMASYYGYSHAGNMTASGELFDPEGYTAAHRTMPFGTRLLVSHNGNSVVVTVNDRGPYADGIDIDLSQAAADTVGMTQLGIAPVEVDVL
jgi:hypothetical protein